MLQIVKDKMDSQKVPLEANARITKLEDILKEQA
jgi:hypothetical protein